MSKSPAFIVVFVNQTQQVAYVGGGVHCVCVYVWVCVCVHLLFCSSMFAYWVCAPIDGTACSK